MQGRSEFESLKLRRDHRWRDWFHCRKEKLDDRHGERNASAGKECQDDLGSYGAEKFPEHWPNKPSGKQRAYLHLKRREVVPFRADAGMEIRTDDTAARHCRKHLHAIEEPKLVKSSKATQMKGNGARAAAR